MSLRREPTYLSSDVWRSCKILAQWRSTQLDDQGLHRTTSTDQIASELLHMALKEWYPQLLEHHKRIEKLDEELVKSLEDEK
jgi:hypothetical protein